MAGAALVLIESGGLRARLAVPWLFAAAQLAAMFAAVYWITPSAPQARYLFPAFVPITVLLYLGLRRVMSAAFQRHWAQALLVVLVALDVTGITTVHIPVYLR